MALMLAFVGEAPDGLPARYVVPPGGASIGRGQANDLVLPDPEQKLSRRHCEIRPDRGGWLLFDSSTNGTFLNDQPERLDPRVPVLLQNGDSIILGTYTMVVQIEADAPAYEPDYGLAPAPPVADVGAGRFDDFDRLRHDPGAGAAGVPADDPFAAFDLEPSPSYGTGAGAPPPASDFRLDEPGEAQGRRDLYQVGRVEPAADFAARTVSDTDDPFAAFDLEGPIGMGAQADHADHGNIQFTPPQSRRDVLPENWMDEEPLAPPVTPPVAPPPVPESVSVPGSGGGFDDEGFGPGAEPTAPPPRPVVPETPAYPPPPAYQTPAYQAPAYPPPPAADAGDALSAFLSGAGIATPPPGDATAAIHLAGQIFRVLVEGARDLIQTRAKLKNEFRIEQTMIGSANNNPLKFAMTAEDALTAMLQPARQGYLGPVDSAREVFADLQSHEIAVMVAIQAAMKTVLKRLDPTMIKAKIDADSGGFTIGGGKKNRYWDLYEILFAEVVGGLDEDFDKLFGRAFAAAYEEQVRRL
ncbi:type VI secretion system-associated FHA domain protein TagH [Zavarzinia sp.]|uniref:type VI secretion system-associated FHA domain protein TagH n=1 Tax=Zavarzinia sp. TaxID=2027920 RepID=UPI003563A089